MPKLLKKSKAIKKVKPYQRPAVPQRPRLGRAAKRQRPPPLISNNAYASHSLNLTDLANSTAGKSAGKSSAEVNMGHARAGFNAFNIPDGGDKTKLLGLFGQADGAKSDFVQAQHNARDMPTSVIFKPFPNNHGREVTPESKDRLDNDDRSHTVTQSLMINPSNANKSNLMISENYVGNQVVFANAEREAHSLAITNPGNVLVHRQMEYGDNDRPTKVTNTVLKRSNSFNNVQVVSSFSHSNRDVFRQ